MKKQENQKPEKEIVKDLQEVHENIKIDKEKKYDPNELSHKTKALDKQMEGSDADRDRSVEGEEVGKDNAAQVREVTLRRHNPGLPVAPPRCKCSFKYGNSVFTEKVYERLCWTKLF